MVDLKIPNLNNKSDKFLFKKKLSLRRKSKTKLLKESFLMLALSFLIIYFNYMIPNKKIIFEKFFSNFKNIADLLVETFSYIYEIFLIIFIVISLFFALILILGATTRLLRVARRKTKLLS